MKLQEKVSKVEVMNHLDKEIVDAIPAFLKPIDDIWQPADLLPQADNEAFFDQVKELKAKAPSLSYDLLAVLIGDTITEEALPKKESGLSVIHPKNEVHDSGWNQWVRGRASRGNRPRHV